jgi:hypothetical protein
MDLPLYSYIVQTWKEKIKHTLKQCLPTTGSLISTSLPEIHETQMTLTYCNTKSESSRQHFHEGNIKRVICIAM